jgi:hypothetical protein
MTLAFLPVLSISTEVIFAGDKPTMKSLIGGGLIAGSTAILRYFGSV